MESTCWSCDSGPVVPDPDSGVLVCTSCGLVHDAGAAEFVHQTAFTVKPSQELSSAASTAAAVITSTAAHLGLPSTRVEEVLSMAQCATVGNLATPSTDGDLPALAAACALLVARSHRVPLFLAEAAEAGSCDTFALADLASRIASDLSLPPIPSFDLSAALERAVRRSHLLPTAAGEKMEAILSRARFLLRCASKWALTAGRHPLPLLAGLIGLAAELNGVTSVSVEAIAQEISAAPCTSRRRYKELIAALVRVAQKLLPRGADVDAGNLLPEAPMLFRLMESDQSEGFLESFAPDIAGIVQVYSSVDESKYLQIVDDLDFKNSGQEGNGSEDLKISERCMSDAYQNVSKRIDQLKELLVVGNVVASRREQWKRVLELEPWMGSLDNDWTKDRLLDEVAEIDNGYDAPPPSLTTGMESQKRRRARIEAAKCRIDEIRKAPAASRCANATDSPSALGNEDVCRPQENSRKKQVRKRRDGRDHIMHADHPTEISNALECGKKRQKRGACNGIDSEDCVIELLLLHGAKEAEIEQGQYKKLLESHVFSAVSGD